MRRHAPVARRLVVSESEKKARIQGCKFSAKIALPSFARPISTQAPYPATARHLHRRQRSAVRSSGIIQQLTCRCEQKDGGDNEDPPLTIPYDIQPIRLNGNRAFHSVYVLRQEGAIEMNVQRRSLQRVSL